MAAKAKRTVTVILGAPQEKKNTTRYDSNEDNPAMRTVYIDKVALSELGNPARVKITIEAA